MTLNISYQRETSNFSILFFPTLGRLISSLLSLLLPNFKNMASLTAREGGVPFIISISETGLVRMSKSLLCLRFGFKVGSVQIEEEVFGSIDDFVRSIYQVKD